MSTESIWQQNKSGVINKEKTPHKREIVKLFYSETTWKLSASRELTEGEIDEVIRRITEHYTAFLKENEDELDSFGYDLEFNREPSTPNEKKSTDFKLTVTLSSFHYLPFSSFAPPCIDLPIQESPLDQLSPDVVKMSSANPTPTNGQGGAGNPSGSVAPVLEHVTVKANDSSTPTQDPGGKNPPPIKD